jgi:chlorite dismutase
VSEEGERQFVQYAFYKVDPEWRRLPSGQKELDKKEFMKAVEGFAPRLAVQRNYSLIGIRGDTDFLLWNISEDLETLQELGARLQNTGLGRWLSTPYRYLAMTRQSIYIQGHQHEGQEGTRTRVTVKGTRYLFVYPFVKTRAWYKLPAQERHRIMGGHFKVGHDFPTVHIHTASSIGQEDQQFLLGFETDRPRDFLDRDTTLRDTEASSFTERDTPIFTCISQDLSKILETIG